jgi:toxin FitB
MIVLDTNIVAALMANGADIDPWLATVPRHELYTTVMTRAEIRYGLSRLPASKRRSRLTAEADALFSETQERLLPFDAMAADRYGDLVASREVLVDQSRCLTPSSLASRGFTERVLQRGTSVTSTIAESPS